ncbi:MAG: hypothetical protein QOF62_1976 [Pyrinomonadaceae bacterium]|jgi:UDP:flavonoid glycosyltransferase YjiC (YdhE family)|nr:hypothetical protein [Pyrinomonadaceae bacterium]
MRKKALFTFWDGADGHFFRISAVATIVSRAGFELAFITAKSHKDKVRDRFPQAKIYQIENRKSVIHAPPYQLPLFSHAFRHSQRLCGLEFNDVDFLILTIELELEAIRSFAPNIIFNDYRDTIRTAAEITGTPIIGTTITSGNTAGFPLGWWIPVPTDLKLPDCVPSFNAARSHFGLEPIDDERHNFEGDFNLIPSCEIIDPLKVDRNKDVYVGVPDSPVTTTNDKGARHPRLKAGTKVIFCNLGDDNNGSGWRFDPILCQLCNSFKATFVIAGKPEHYPQTYDLARTSRNILIDETWKGTDYQWITRNADAMISHGGTGALVALQNGIPIIFIPRNTESSTAYRSSEYGAGIYVQHSSEPLARKAAPDLGPGVEILGHWKSGIRAADLRTHLETVLESSSYRYRAQEIAITLNKYSLESESLAILDSSGA